MGKQQRIGETARPEEEIFAQAARHGSMAPDITAAAAPLIAAYAVDRSHAIRTAEMWGQSFAFGGEATVAGDVLEVDPSESIKGNRCRLLAGVACYFGLSMMSTASEQQRVALLRRTGETLKEIIGPEEPEIKHLVYMSFVPFLQGLTNRANESPDMKPLQLAARIMQKAGLISRIDRYRLLWR